MSDIVFIWVVFLLAQLADVATTRAALRAGLNEANPVVKWFMDISGNRWWLIKLAIALLLGLALTWLGQPMLMLIPAAVTAGVAANNWRLTRKHREE